jgi:hypothetical protein
VRLDTGSGDDAVTIVKYVKMREPRGNTVLREPFGGQQRHHGRQIVVGSRAQTQFFAHDLSSAVNALIMHATGKEGG